MITVQEATTGLYAAWRLLLRDRAAVQLLDGSPSGAIKSFFCALIVLPVHVFVILAGPLIPAEIDMGRLLLVDLIAFVIEWAAWPLVMAYLAPAIQRDEELCRYIAARNWAAGPQYLLLFGITLLSAVGLVPKPVFQTLAVVVFLVVLFYDLFIIRVVLRVSAATAVGLLIAATMLGIFISVLRAPLLT
jgi:hypothetical protein